MKLDFFIQVWDRPSCCTLQLVSTRTVNGLRDSMPNGIIDIGKFEKNDDLEYRIGRFVDGLKTAFSHLGIEFSESRDRWRQSGS